MEYLEQVVVAEALPLVDSLRRLGLVVLLSGLVGAERQSSNQPAGLRTHMLIGVGATSLMLLSMHVPIQMEAGDPGRIAAQVVSGIGFLGGGAILRLGADIRGLTTAASIWVVAALGLAVGAGMYGAAVAVTLVVMVTLILLDRLERRLFPKRVLKNLYVYSQSKKLKTSTIEDVLHGVSIRIRSMAVQRSIQKGATRFRFQVYLPPRFDYDALQEQLNELKGVYKIVLEDL